MHRYIDADTLLAEYDKIHIGEPGRARKLIAEQPTIEVVLCKDCLFRRDDHCDNVDYWIKDDDVCSRGEDGRPWRK